MKVLSLSGVVDGGVRGEARACCFISNQEMNSSRILPGIIRAVDASGCSERCLDTLNHLGFKCSIQHEHGHEAFKKFNAPTKERIFIERMTSDHKLKASSEGTK